MTLCMIRFRLCAMNDRIWAV